MAIWRGLLLGIPVRYGRAHSPTARVTGRVLRRRSAGGEPMADAASPSLAVAGNGSSPGLHGDPSRSFASCSRRPRLAAGAVLRCPGPSPATAVGALQVTLTVVVAMQVWRVQELFPVIAFYGLPIAATLAAMLVFWLDRDPRRRLTNLDSHVVGAALGILLLAWLSVPGSLYPGFSAEFLLKDYCRTVVLMLLVAASVRGLADVRRLAWVQIAGVTLFSTVIMARSEIGSDGRLHAVAYYDANDLATLIVCTLPLVLYLWRRNTGLAARLLLAAVTVLLMVTLGRTGSRGGFLGFLAVAAYLLLRLRAVSTAKRAGAVALLAILLVAVAKDTYFERMETLLHPSPDYNWSGQSGTGRGEFWKRGVG